SWGVWGPVSSGLRTRASLIRSRPHFFGSLLCPPVSSGLRTRPTLLRSKTRCVGSLLCPPVSSGLRTRPTLLRSKTRCVGTLLCPPASQSYSGYRPRAGIHQSIRRRRAEIVVRRSGEGTVLREAGQLGAEARPVEHLRVDDVGRHLADRGPQHPFRRRPCRAA